MAILNPGYLTTRLVIFLITIQFVFPATFFSQKIQSTSFINFESRDSLSVIKIKFLSPSLVYSLLVLVTNQEGNTVYLDTRQRFNGNYDKSFSISKNTKGNFTLTIISDEEKINRKFSIK